MRRPRSVPGKIAAFLARFPRSFPPQTEAEAGNAAVVRALEEVLVTAPAARTAA